MATEPKAATYDDAVRVARESPTPDNFKALVEAARAELAKLRRTGVRTR